MKFHPGHGHKFLMHEPDGAPIPCQSVYTGSPLTMIERVAQRACEGKGTLLHIETGRLDFDARLVRTSVWLRIEPMDPPEIPTQEDAQ